MRRTKEQAAETRQGILANAEALFLDRGYENVSLDQIALSAGVTRGAVHWHFKNKKGLLAAIRDEMPLPLQELAEKITADTTIAPIEALANVIEDAFRRLQSDPRRRGMIREVLRFEANRLDEGIANAEFQRHLRRLLTKIFNAAERTGGFQPPWKPSSAAIALNAMLNGLINEWARGQTDFELIPDAITIIRTVLTSWAMPSVDRRGSRALKQVR